MSRPSLSLPLGGGVVVMATKQAARRRPHCIGSQETKKRGTKINQSGAQAMCPNWTQTKCSSSCLRASPAITYKSDPLNAKWGRIYFTGTLLQL